MYLLESNFQWLTNRMEKDEFTDGTASDSISDVKFPYNIVNCHQ